MDLDNFENPEIPKVREKIPFEEKPEDKKSRLARDKDELVGDLREFAEGVISGEYAQVAPCQVQETPGYIFIVALKNDTQRQPSEFSRHANIVGINRATNAAVGYMTLDITRPWATFFPDRHHDLKASGKILVLEEFRGKGIGGAIVRVAEDMIQRHADQIREPIGHGIADENSVHTRDNPNRATERARWIKLFSDINIKDKPVIPNLSDPTKVEPRGLITLSKERGLVSFSPDGDDAAYRGDQALLTLLKHTIK